MEMKAKMDAKHKKLVLSIVVGAIGGFLVSFTLMRTIQSGVLGELGASRSIAAVAGSMYVLCGAFVGFGSLNPKMGAKFLNVEDADELAEQSAILRNSTMGIGAFGVCLILLALAAPLGPVPQGVVAGSIVALMALCAFTSLRSVKLMDELNASLSKETAVASFYLMFTLGAGWSVAAHLGYAPGLAALDWLTLFAATMLAGAFWAAGRRGLLVPR